MTDRYAGFVVTLAQDTREDDAQATIDAIKQLKGVLTVEPVLGGADIAIATNRARYDLMDKVYAAFNPPKRT